MSPCDHYPDPYCPVDNLHDQLRVANASRDILMDRIAKADAAAAQAVREMSAYARRCGELEAQLCAQLVEHPGRKAMLLVLEELRRDKLKHPWTNVDDRYALAILMSEAGELAKAVYVGDIHGGHGVIREAAQVGAVAIRIVEMAQGMVEVE